MGVFFNQQDACWDVCSAPCMQGSIAHTFLTMARSLPVLHARRVFNLQLCSSILPTQRQCMHIMHTYTHAHPLSADFQGQGPQLLCWSSTLADGTIEPGDDKCTQPNESTLRQAVS